MEPSLFKDLVERYFPSLVLSTVKLVNDQTREDALYFPRFLRRRFSLSGKWEALAQSNSRIMADVVAMDSSLPLKRRESVSKAQGEIPKVGMEMQLNETQLTELLTMQRAGFNEEQLIDELFRDTVTCIRGQYERLDYLFLKGLSAGVVEVNNTNNVGLGVRLDFQYPTANQFQSTIAWNSPLATPFTDLQPLLDKARADGNPIRIIMLDRTTWTHMLGTEEAQNVFAVFSGVNTGSALVIPPDRFNDAVSSIYGFRFEIVERTCKYQINGVNTDVNPWEAGQIIALNNTNVGDLVWSLLAEAQRPVAGVAYQVADEFILARKYHTVRPSFAEFTASQSRALPVIAAVNQIYKLDTTVTATT